MGARSLWEMCRVGRLLTTWFMTVRAVGSGRGPWKSMTVGAKLDIVLLAAERSAAQTVAVRNARWPLLTGWQVPEEQYSIPHAQLWLRERGRVWVCKGRRTLRRC